MNVSKFGLSNFTHRTGVLFTVAAGVAGWVDTDVSAVTGLDTTKVWLISCESSPGGGIVGARPHGSALEPELNAQLVTSTLSKVDSTGHMDLRRIAGHDTKYTFIGYFE